MTDPVEVALVDSIVDLSPDDANRFIGSLLRAEADFLGLPANTFTYATEANERDGGVDGYLDLAGTDDPPFPAGVTVWQFKSTASPPTLARDWSANSKQFLRDQVRDGADFVMAWTRARPRRVVHAFVGQFEAAVREVRRDAKFYFISAIELARMALRHPGVTVDFSLTPFAGLLDVDQWARGLRGSDIPFFTDANRQDVVREISAWASATTAEKPKHLVGNSGVGKSRTALHVLSVGERSLRVLYAANPDDIPSQFWPWMWNTTKAQCFLVVDQCPLESVEGLHGKAAVSDFRVRLLTIGDRGSYRASNAAPDCWELNPLDSDDLQEALKNSLNLTDEQANFVARHTQGYPRLAWVASEALARNPNINVRDLSKAQTVELLLDRMLPGADRQRLLGVLALFTQVGFDDEVEDEAREICEAFGIDLAAFREAAEVEKDVIRRAGRYRHVTPLLLAIWIGAGRITAFGAQGLGQRLGLLQTPSLLPRFREQLARFGPIPEARAIIAEVLGVQAGPFDVAAVGRSARFLLAAAAIDRALVVRFLEANFKDGRPQLTDLQGRQEIVWAIQYALWFADTFDIAQRLIVWLALAEPTAERVTQLTTPATDALANSFQVHLGGTSVPVWERVEALDKAVRAEGTDEARRLASRVLPSALSLREGRTSSAIHGGEPLPEEWRPTTQQEEQRARLSAWRSLVEVSTSIGNDTMREEALLRLAGHLGEAIRALPGSEVLPVVERLDLSAKARATAAREIRSILEYESVDDEYAARMRGVIAALQGEDLQHLIPFVFASSPWELSESKEEERGRPKLITELASRLAQHVALVRLALNYANDGDTTTVGQVFEHVATATMQRDEVWDAIVEQETIAWVAGIGFLAGRDRLGDGEWVDERLRHIRADARLLPLLAAGIFAVVATDERAQLAIEAMESGSVPAREFRRLMYGSWVLPLSEPVLARLLRNVARDDGDAAYEASIAMLDQYVSQQEQVSAELAALTAELLTRASSGSPMLWHYRDDLLKRVPVPFEVRLQMLLNRMTASDDRMLDQEFGLFDALVRENPLAVLVALTSSLIEDTRQKGWSRWGFRLRAHHYISRAAHLVGPDPVFEVVQPLSEDDWRLLLAHLDFSGREPDLIMRWIIEHSTRDDLLSSATTQFILTPDSWSGSRVPILEQRREDALAWTQVGGNRFRTWAASLVPRLDAEISRERQSDEEELL